MYNLLIHIKNRCIGNYINQRIKWTVQLILTSMDIMEFVLQWEQWELFRFYYEINSQASKENESQKTITQSRTHVCIPIRIHKTEQRKWMKTLSFDLIHELN